MAAWLTLLIALVIVVVVYASTRRRSTEGFGEFLNQQKAFGDSQRVYFHDKAAKGILTNPGLSLADLNIAAAQPDYDLPVNKFKDMTTFFMEDPENAWTDEDNKMCRGAKHPRDLPARADRETVGCGWYYFEDPDRPSIGAMGTKTGPALPDSLPPGGTWIWNRNTAAKLEDIKLCKAIRSCEFVDLDDVAGQCAFCAEKGHAIPIESNGTPKYPEEMSCGSDLIRNSDACAAPEEEVLAGTGRSCGKAGRPSADGSKRLYTAAECAALGGTHLPGDMCVRPDDGGNFSLECAGLNTPSTSRSGCPVSGGLNRACVLQLAARNGLSNTGGMINLINSRTITNMTADALKTLTAAGIDIPDTLWKTESNDAAKVNSVFRNIANVGRRTDKSDTAAAAKFLMDGTAFNPCSSYKPDQRGPFNIDCLQRAFRRVGCQAGGAAYPSERSAVAELANKTWSQVNTMFQQTFSDMKSSDPRTQDLALKNCLGSGSEFHRTVGKTCWKCADGINTPMRRNEKGDIECASTDGYNCLWKSNVAECERSLAQLPTMALNPLACGEDHKKKYGADGYDSPSHWCAKAAAGGAHNGPAAKSWIDTAVEGAWVKMFGGLATISIGADNTIWGANADTLIFRCSGPSANPDWAQMPGLALQADCKNRDSAVVVGTDTKPGGNGLYVWNGSNWRNLPGSGVWISIGSDGTMVAVNDVGTIFVWNGSSWTTGGNGAAQIAVANRENIYGVSKDGRIFKAKVGGNWTVLPGNLARIAVSGDGSKLVGVSKSDEIFAWDGSNWRKIPGSLKNISVNNDYIVGVNRSDEIFYLKLT